MRLNAWIVNSFFFQDFTKRRVQHGSQMDRVKFISERLRDSRQEKTVQTWRNCDQLYNFIVSVEEWN